MLQRVFGNLDTVKCEVYKRTISIGGGVDMSPYFSKSHHSWMCLLKPHWNLSSDCPAPLDQTREERCKNVDILINVLQLHQSNRFTWHTINIITTFIIMC